MARRKKKERALDDEFAKDTGEAETLEGLKDKLRTRLQDADKARIEEEQRARRAQAEQRQQAVAGSLAAFSGQVREALMALSSAYEQMRATAFIFSYGGFPPKSDEMIASSPSISVTSEFAPPPNVGASIVPFALIT